MTPFIRPATLADAQHIAQRLRPQDQDELRATGRGPDFDAVLAESMRASLWCDVAVRGDEPLAIFGVGGTSEAPLLGSPWLLGTTGMEQLGRHFIRGCRPVVDRMLATRPALVNFVHRDNTVSRRWLAWLGFRFAYAYAGAAIRQDFIAFFMAVPALEQQLAEWLAAWGFVQGRAA